MNQEGKLSRSTVAALVTKTIAGDARSFEELYSAHAQTILFHCRNLILDKNNYEDVAQEVAIALFQNINTLKEPKAFSGWMHRIIRNICINHNEKFLRGAESKIISDSDEQMMNITTVNPEDNPESAVIENYVFFEMLREMPPGYRDTLILRYYDELSYKEIADVLGIAISTVGTNITKAKKHLKKIIQAGENEVRSEKINRMLVVGVNSMVPIGAVKHFVNFANANISLHPQVVAAGVASASSGGAGAGSVIAGVACSLVIGAGSVGLAINGSADNEIAYTETTVLTQSDIQQEKAPDSINIGEPHIVFTNTAGTGDRRNITSIEISENGTAAKNMKWIITNKDGATVLSGAGSSVTSGLGSLTDGAYKARFTLTYKDGSTAGLSRSFYIDRGQ